VQITITERHGHVTDAVKDYVQEKASKLLRFFNRISAIEVILDGDQDRNSVEMIVKVDGSENFVACDAYGDFFVGTDVVVGKLERQISKHKGKFRNRKHLAKNPSKEV